MYPTPHFEKLLAVLKNEKLPSSDKPRIEKAIEHYQEWIARLDRTMAAEDTPDDILKRMVSLLNEYRMFIDIDLIYDDQEDFLYRQKGQLKLDNSVIEEFLPRLMHPILVPEIEQFDVKVGPTRSFASAYFALVSGEFAEDAALRMRTKDQDFAISKRLYLKASFSPNFQPASHQETNLAFMVAECKTNLDKTMFQEATATAHDVKTAMTGARYYLLCEWLDMTPLSTAPTDIDEVIILRKAKRIGSNFRKHLSTHRGRQDVRETYIHHLTRYPLQASMFKRFIDHVRGLLSREGVEEHDILDQGYF
ncbi:MAG: Bpu10I family restriction endonuclease [Chloroflexaceae bacterium]|nr:Bpu10I family restriction endonuclease [Chloroflexaceae bacterium]